MQIEKRRFPILECIDNNHLIDRIYRFLSDSGYDIDGVFDIAESLPAFFNKSLKIDYISKKIHEQLLDTSTFLNAKIMLQDSDEITGLLTLSVLF